MKIKINKCIEEDWQLPVYVSYGGYAKVEEDKVLFVDESNDHLQVYQPHMIDHFLSVGRPVDKACFENAFQRALSKFNELDREMKANDPEFLEDMNEEFHETNNRMIEEFGHEREQFNL